MSPAHLLADPADLHPYDGPRPAQFTMPEGVLGGAADACEGSPPFINRRLTVAEWAAYVAAYDFGPLPPSRLVLHHTVVPTAKSWAGATTMRAMQRYYAGKGWESGPHVYAAPDGIWLATPLYNVGIHAGAGNGSVKQGWYSIGLEVVGDFDQARPAGPVWAYSLAVMGELSRRLAIPPRQLISFHRDYTTAKSCPGWALTKAWVWAAVEASLAGCGPEHYDAQSPLTGHTGVTAADAARWVNGRGSAYTPYDVTSICNLYWRWGESAGLNPLIALAQSIHETSAQIDNDPPWEPWGAWWSQRPRRNPAGIGVTGASAPEAPRGFQHRVGSAFYDTWAVAGAGRWSEGVSFPSWDVAVQAHMGRLLLYTQGMIGTPEQRRLAEFAHAVRPLDPRAWGSVHELAHLGALLNPANAGLDRAAWTSGWAWPGGRYGAQIAAVANLIAGGGA
jgi:hypothetical protein